MGREFEQFFFQNIQKDIKHTKKRVQTHNNLDNKIKITAQNNITCTQMIKMKKTSSINFC